jgi:hypothetical protein
MAKFCPECGASVAGMKFCSECGALVGDAPATEPPAPTLLSHDEQVAILNSAIAELAKQGWHEWTHRPTPYEVSLRRKSGLFARQFIALWVEDDGTLQNGGILEGGRVVDMVTLPFGKGYRKIT